MAGLLRMNMQEAVLSGRKSRGQFPSVPSKTIDLASPRVPDAQLLGAMNKMLVIYLPQNNRQAVCQIVTAYNGGDVGQCSPLPPTWTPSYSQTIAATTLHSASNDQANSVRLLGFIAQYGLAVPGSYPYVPAMVACDMATLGFTPLEYAYLWDGIPGKPFCQVKLPDGTVNYTPISHALDLLNNGGTAPAVSVMITQYQDALTSLDIGSMNAACQSMYTYSQMNIVPLQELCGCYIGVPNTPEFTSDEKVLLAQNPQCIPSCLAAAVRYSVGGVPVPCQQSLCIADDINVSGSTTSISQVCPQCPKRFQCVCYVHINGRTLNNDTCNTVYTVAPDGTITNTIHNNAPSAGSGIKQAWDSFIRSPSSLIFLAILVVIIAAVGFTLLILQYRRNRTAKLAARQVQEPLGYAQHSASRL